MTTNNVKEFLNWVFISSIVLGLFGCGSYEGNDSMDDADDVITTSSLSISTYNVGLALNFVPYTQERVAINQTLIREHDADVLCLQEVWLEEHADAIQASLADNYPFTYRQPAGQIFADAAACTLDDVTPFADCTNTQCPDLNGGALVGCAVESCGSFMAALDPNCLTALTASVGIPNITVEKLVDAVTKPSGEFSYEGATGTILASKYPLNNIEFQDFINDSSTTHRGVIYAEITLNNTDHVIGCTHLTANLDGALPYPEGGKHGSWEGENEFQVKRMIDYANKKAGTNPLYLTGDFNCGLENVTQGVGSEFPTSCQHIINDGFADPAADAVGCTYCETSNLILNEAFGDTKGGKNIYIDHVYIKNISPTTANTMRIFDDSVEINALDPAQELTIENSPLLTHPSDHFGTQVEFIF